MKQFLLILATLGLAFALPRQNPPHSVRIVGGDEISIKDAPYQVSFIRKGFLWCGGTLIAPRIVVTGAYCVVPSVIPDLSIIKVRSASSRYDRGGLLLNVNKIVVHPDYKDCDDCDLANNIAVVFLDADAIGSSFLSKVIEIVDAGTTFPAGTSATVSGWGDLSEFGESPSMLRRVTLPLVSQESCQKAYGSVITEKYLCAGLEEGGKDSCDGDSGGPLIIDGKLAGTVSYGDGCGEPGRPGVYTNVSSFRDWIKETTGI